MCWQYQDGFSLLSGSVMVEIGSKFDVKGIFMSMLIVLVEEIIMDFGSSMINEGEYARIFAGSKSGYDMTVGFSVV